VAQVADAEQRQATLLAISHVSPALTPSLPHSTVR